MENKQPVTVDLPHEGRNLKVTFHQSRPIGMPLNGMADAHALKVQHALVLIAPYEQEIHQWVSASQENALLFTQNPFKAIETAGINIPADVLNEIKSTSDLLANTLNK